MLRLPPQLTTSLPHRFPSSPLPIVTTSLPHHFPSSPPPFFTTSHRPHLPSSPFPFIITSLRHHFPSSPLPFVTTSLRHHFPSSPLPIVTTSLRHHFPSSPLPFVTTRHYHHPSLRHHFPSSPPVIITTLHQSQFHCFFFFCYVLLCYVLLCDLPPCIISSRRILFVRNTEVLLPNFLWLCIYVCVYKYICYSFIPYFINLTTKQNPSTNGIETFEERDAMRSSRAKREERPATKAWSRGSRWPLNWGNVDNTVEITLWKSLEYGFTLKN